MVESTKAEKSKVVDDDYPLDRMLDPIGDRAMKDVPLPPRYPLTYKQLFTQTNSAGKTTPDMKLVRQHLMLEGHIEKECLVEIIL